MGVPVESVASQEHAVSAGNTALPSLQEAEARVCYSEQSGKVWPAPAVGRGLNWGAPVENCSRRGASQAKQDTGLFESGKHYAIMPHGRQSRAHGRSTLWHKVAFFGGAALLLKMKNAWRPSTNVSTAFMNIITSAMTECRQKHCGGLYPG